MNRKTSPNKPNRKTLRSLKSLFKMLEGHPDEAVRRVYTDQIRPLLEGKELDPNLDWPNPHVYNNQEGRFVPVMEILSKAGRWSAAQTKASPTRRRAIAHKKRSK